MLISNLLSSKPYPDELLNLYNPAYVASIVYMGGRAFEEKSKRELPIYFPFVMLPLVAIDKLRARLPQKSGKLSDWARQHGDALFDFPERVAALRPFVSSGLVFLQSRSLIEFRNDTIAFHFARSRSLIKDIEALVVSSENVRDELERAPAVGRLLAVEDDTAAVLATFGLKP